MTEKKKTRRERLDDLERLVGITPESPPISQIDDSLTFVQRIKRKAGEFVKVSVDDGPGLTQDRIYNNKTEDDLLKKAEGTPYSVGGSTEATYYEFSSRWLKKNKKR